MKPSQKLLFRFFAVAFMVGVYIFPIKAEAQKQANDTAIPAAVIVCEGENQILDFAKEELSRFLSQANMEIVSPEKSEASNTAWQFILRVKNGMEPYSFRVSANQTENRKVVELAGADETCVLHAIYTALERIGYQFEINDPILLSPPDLNRLLEEPVTIRPVVQIRGPRLYMNFPMDLSGYSLPEAKEYVRNLARMRFNHLSFHSYKGIFIQVLNPDGKDQLAGNMSYGVRHDIPDLDWLKAKIRNQRTFCMPELEPVFDDPKLRSEKTVAWMREVMEEAKRAGLTIQFSFEPERQDADLTETIRTANAIVQSYPLIDILELVTQEGGGSAVSLSAEEMVNLFGHCDVLNLADGRNRREGYRYYSLNGQIGHNILAIRELQKQWQGQDKPLLKCGLYNTDPDHFPSYLQVMKRFTPPEFGIGTLPGYASEYTAEYIRDARLNPHLLRRLSVYSWFEFDGMMYLHQNGLEGIYQLLQELSVRAGAGPVPYISFIHWRVTANRLPARYAALSCLQGPIPLESFYREYAVRLGFSSAGEVFAEAMSQWNRADAWVFHHMGNIGFCARGCWSPQGGLGYFGRKKWNDTALATAISHYNHALDLLSICAKYSTQTAGCELLNFLDRGLRCNILYLRAFWKATELQAVCGEKKPDELTPEEKQKVVQICEEALNLMDQWMKLYAERMYDRSEEGLLISFYHTPIAELKRIRHEYAGIGPDQPPKPDCSLPGPPEPLQFTNP